MNMNLIEKYIGEADKYEIRSAGDGYSITGPLKPNQKYHDKQAKKVRNIAASDGLWDTYEKAENKVKQLKGVLRSKEEIKKIYTK